MDHARATRLLTALLLTAFAVSVVHYTDNYFNYEEFPRSGTLPNPSAGVVGISWFLFTAFGIAGYMLFLRRSYAPAALCLAAYSGSGLVGVLHYSVSGMTDAVWWRQTHVIADVLLGVAVLAFAVWTALVLAPREAGGSTRG
jgi:hypothetical protein